MSQKDDGRPAFPRVVEDEHVWRDTPGMTLRQWYAGQALNGLLASDVNDVWTSAIPSLAVDLADALIAELDKA